MKIEQRNRTLAFGFTGALVGLFLLNISLGSIAIPFADVIGSIFSENEDFSAILWQFRLPKAVTCVLAGGALGISGLLMQTLFRNPLAGPDVLGLSSGASLFVALLLLGGQTIGQLLFFTTPWSIALAASVGSGLVFMALLAISRKIDDNSSLLIIGLMVAALVSSMVAVLQYISRAEDLQAFMIWALGSVGSTGWPEIAIITLLVVVGSGIALVQVKSINGLLLGDNYARSLGINVRKTRFWLVTATSLMTGVITAFCGPIAFVGLAVPHLVRMTITTTNHRTLIPLVMLGGAILILLCDLISQLPGATQMLPLNAVTSFFGAPVVIWVIIRNKKLRL
jgi:iron complex transport system permease protein